MDHRISGSAADCCSDVATITNWKYTAYEWSASCSPDAPGICGADFENNCTCLPNENCDSGLCENFIDPCFVTSVECPGVGSFLYNCYTDCETGSGCMTDAECCPLPSNCIAVDCPSTLSLTGTDCGGSCAIDLSLVGLPPFCKCGASSPGICGQAGPDCTYQCT
jgi:hypothetical protein